MINGLIGKMDEIGIIYMYSSIYQSEVNTMAYEPVVSERIGLVEIPSASLIIQYIFLGGSAYGRVKSIAYFFKFFLAKSAPIVLIS